MVEISIGFESSLSTNDFVVQVFNIEDIPKRRKTPENPKK
jgi:hypothetical protein